jgi:SP family general alpha glucoside:H+ symporter-like MFS transporter
MAQQAKANSEMIENSTIIEEMRPPVPKGSAPLMRSKADDLTVWQTVHRYKRVGFIAMAAAFCASLGGYRKAFITCRSADPEGARADMARQ